MTSQAVGIDEFVHAICDDRDIASMVAHHTVLPARRARMESFPDDMPPAVADALRARGIQKLYAHQAETRRRLNAGEAVVVTTPTASGKTLCYNLPVIEDLRAHDGHALFLFPIKALGHDQKKAFDALASGLNLASAVYDGDTSRHHRTKLRATPPAVLISNPDMLHYSLLPYHEQWKHWWAKLRWIVVDEMHAYRGVFGSHVGNVLRRAWRIAALHGAQPRLIGSSATIANAADLAEQLTGRPCTAVTDTGAPQPQKHVVFLNPDTIKNTTLASRLFVRALGEGLKTIAFTKSRVATELLHRWTQDASPSLGKRVSSYRGGFMPEERRTIERDLFEGRLDGVISTSALEMGIDVGGLDVCILVGYPGSVVTTWQRSGRVGRGSAPAAIFLLAGQDSLDQYFMRHPEEFFGRCYEEAIVDTANPYILKGHLVCAAAEEPLTRDDAHLAVEQHPQLVRALELDGELAATAEHDMWLSTRQRPHRFVDIRNVGESVAILDDSVNADTPRIVGKVSGRQALVETHPGAVYLHRGRTYLIRDLDLEKLDAHARPTQVNYYTRAFSDKETDILETWKSRPAGNFLVRLGRVKVTETITGYRKYATATGEVLSDHSLDLPPRVYETVGLWMEIDDFIATRIKAEGLHFMGSIHAIEHTLISLFPLFAMAERDDVGGISQTMHPQIQKAAIFIYDGFPGGVGLAERAFAVIEHMADKALDLISECECEERDGCPSCIHSPKCGSGNTPLDKKGAMHTLRMLLGKENVSVEVEDAEPEYAPQEMEPPVDERRNGHRVLVFDLETQKSAADVGGWRNTHLMGLAAGVIYDSRTGEFAVYEEDRVDALIDHLASGDLVVGFNIRRFDYGVLKGYTTKDLGRLPTFDILEAVHAHLKFRLSLDHLCQHTLGRGKTADGLQSLEWVKQGRMDLVIDYCTEDVRATRDLFMYGCEHGHLLYASKGKDATVLRLPVQWDIDALVRERVRA